MSRSVNVMTRPGSSSTSSRRLIDKVPDSILQNALSGESVPDPSLQGHYPTLSLDVCRGRWGLVAEFCAFNFYECAPARISAATGLAVVSAAAAGSVMVNDVPAPGRVETVTLPPWATTMRRTSESPSPCP